MFKNAEEYKKLRAKLIGEAENLLGDGDLEGFNAKESEIKEFDRKFEAWTKGQANLNALRENTLAEPFVNVLRQPEEINAIQQKTAVAYTNDKYASIEYRQAFMNFAQTGKVNEFLNVDQFTTTDDVGVVIPTTIMTEVIKKAEVYGQIYQKVRKTNIKGGVSVPILTIKPVATWIDENTPSGRQKNPLKDKLTFSYYGLECKIATSLLADIVTLDLFEKLMIDLIVEAMIKAIESAIIAGDGQGKPQGITTDSRIPVVNVIALTPKQINDWSAWKKQVFAKIPLAYRAHGSFIMAAGTFEGYIDGMTDANGQPIGRVNYNITNAPQERFGGREVMLVEDDVVAPYDAANVGDVIAVFVRLSDYCINSNMQMRMFRWLDNDNNQWVDKALMVVDGKILDPNGVLIIKKGE